LLMDIITVNDKIFVADYEEKEINIFNLNRMHTNQIKTKNKPTALAADPHAHRLFVLFGYAYSIEVYDARNFTKLARYSNLPIAAAQGITVNKDGTVLVVSDTKPCRFITLRLGERIEDQPYIDERVQITLNNNALVCPMGLAMDKDNNLYVADAKNHFIIIIKGKECLLSERNDEEDYDPHEVLLAAERDDKNDTENNVAEASTTAGGKRKAQINDERENARKRQKSNGQSQKKSKGKKQWDRRGKGKARDVSDDSDSETQEFEPENRHQEEPEEENGTEEGAGEDSDNLPSTREIPENIRTIRFGNLGAKEIPLKLKGTPPFHYYPIHLRFNPQSDGRLAVAVPNNEYLWILEDGDHFISIKKFQNFVGCVSLDFLGSKILTCTIHGFSVREWSN